jgi:hypothetical protein
MHYCYVAHEADACRQFRVYPLLSILVQNIIDTADTASKERH